MKRLKGLLRAYYLIVGILAVIIYIVAAENYEIKAILISGLFAILLGAIPYFQFESILKIINELKNKR